MKRTVKRLLMSGAALAAALIAAAAVALHFAAGALQAEVRQALGPHSEVGALRVGWSSIEIRDVRIPGPPGWPTGDALRAERIEVTPDLLGLFSARLHVSRVTIDHAYVSVLRNRAGKLQLLPGLLDRKQSAGGAAVPPFSIGTIVLRHGMLDFFDASIRTPPHRTSLQQLHARVDDLRFPGLGSRTDLQVDGVIKGPQHDGRLAITGWAELGKHNSEIATKLEGVDLVVLQPYLVKASEAGVRRGTLDLTLKSTVRSDRLRAPGTVTLNGLELAPGGGPLASFMGVPRQAVLAALKNRKGQITVNFLLEGRLDDPRFSLNENFVKQLGTALAHTLGINIEGLTQGMGGAVEGLGNAVRKLFGK